MSTRSEDEDETLELMFEQHVTHNNSLEDDDENSTDDNCDSGAIKDETFESRRLKRPSLDFKLGNKVSHMRGWSEDEGRCTAIVENIGQQTRSKDDMNIGQSSIHDHHHTPEPTSASALLGTSPERMKSHRRTRSDGMYLKKRQPAPIVVDPDIYGADETTALTTASDLFSNVGGTPVMRRKHFNRTPSTRSITAPNSRTASPVMSETTNKSGRQIRFSSKSTSQGTWTRANTPLVESDDGIADAGAPMRTMFGMPRTLMLYLGIFVLSGISLGYDLGITSTAKIKLEEIWDLTPTQAGVLSGFLNIGSAVGALCAGAVSDKFGRRAALMWSGLFQMGGSILMALSVSLPMLYSARFIEGVGVGAALMVMPLFLAELSPQRYRGALVAIVDVSIGVGTVLGYFCGWALFPTGDDVGWRWMLGLGAVPASFVVALVVLMPESPRWLMGNGAMDEAEVILNEICTPEEAEMAVFMIQQEREATKRGAWGMLFCPPPGWRGMLFVGFGVAVLQQATGIESATYYTPEILRNAGVADQNEQLLYTLLVGSVKVVFVILATLLIDKRLGRRPMLLMSAAGMTLSQLLLGVNYHYNHQERPTVAVVAQLGFVASYSIGFGPVAWVLMSEIFPVQVRGTALGVATFFNRVTNAVVASTYLTLQLGDGLGSGGVAFLYASTSFVAFAFVFFTVPETKGKSLEDIEGMMKDVGCCVGFGGHMSLKRGYARIAGR
eukprot:m.27687 g.27687  ORF g.27687 m.27687 type:complete len:725 (+) comp15790_c0_seq1:435-2609(+)